MYAIYDGNLIPGTASGQPPATPTGAIKVPLDQNIVSLDFYNMSPFRLQISVSGGQPDIYMAPNSQKEHVYIGRQSGASINVAEKSGHPTSIQIIACVFTPGTSTFIGAFAVMGFRVDEDWTDKKRPIIAGSVTPLLGSSPTASQLVNQGNSAGTNVISTSTGPPGSGSININNDGSGDIKLMDVGNVYSYIHLVDGSALTQASAAFGTTADLSTTTFNGIGNFSNTTIGSLVSAGGIACVGQWVTIQHVRSFHVTATTLQSPIGISAPLTGLYRINASLNKKNVTASAIQMLVNYTDPITSVNITRFLSCDNQSGAYLQLRGVTTVTAITLSTFTMIFPALTSTNIVGQYQDPTGTPDDYVDMDLEVFVI